jgi:salicylate biosynthesis isochorismate synthase
VKARGTVPSIRDTLAPQQNWLSSEAETRLRKRLGLASRRARPADPVLVSVSERLTGERDPSAIVISSRREGEPWFCIEQPERDRTALATIGSVLALEAAGPKRFVELERRWQQLSGSALGDLPDAPSGTGLIATAGFAFDDHGAGSPTWDGFGSASLTVPEISFTRAGTETWITCNLAVHVGDDPDAAVEGMFERLSSLTEFPLPLLDPSPTGRFVVQSPIPPAHYEEAVARAVQRIRDGEFEKIVLAREVQVRAPQPHDPGAVFDVLRGGFPECFVYAVGRGAATFIGATPELLIRKQGMRASTVALAGSTRRSADPAVDNHLGESLLRSEKNRHENEVVAQRISKTLAPFSVWVTVANEPVLVRVANIQHLATPVRAQLTSAVSALELAGALHPTPAVGGEPDAVTKPLIPALEGLDRGWFAGAVGWVDTTGDGELCVALRCALLRDELACCYAGCGIVEDSDPAAELAETETKLQAVLPVLSG